MVAVKVYAVFFAAALSKRVVMVARERGEHGNAGREESIVEKVTVTVKDFCFLQRTWDHDSEAAKEVGEIQTGSPQGPVEPVDYIKQRNAHTYLQEETVCGVKCGLEKKNPDAKRVRHRNMAAAREAATRDRNGNNKCLLVSHHFASCSAALKFVACLHPGQLKEGRKLAISDEGELTVER